MSINIDLEKINYNKFVNKLLKNKEINDKQMLEKIILEFGNKIGDDLVILSNEYYEEGHCLWNMFNLITKYFKLENDELISNVWYEFREELISYKDIDEACDNLRIEIEESEDK